MLHQNYVTFESKYEMQFSIGEENEHVQPNMSRHQVHWAKKNDMDQTLFISRFKRTKYKHKMCSFMLGRMGLC